MLTTSALSAQQEIVSESPGPFTAVSITGNISAQLIPAETNKIDVKLSEVDINKFRWGVRGGTLHVELNSGSRGLGRADVKIYYADTLALITLSASELLVESPIGSDVLGVRLGGTARLTMAVNVIDLDMEVSGSSAATLTGAATYITLRASENSKVDTRETDCLSAVVSTSSKAEVYVTARERLVANAKTASNIFYRGNPLVIRNLTSKINSKMMGSGVFSIGEAEE